MTSFISSFKEVVFPLANRRSYLVVALSQFVTFLLVVLSCHLWLRYSLHEFVSEFAALTPNSTVLVVGSSHLLDLGLEKDGVKAANLSHPANGLEMIERTVHCALKRAPGIKTVVFEVGHIVIGSDPLRLRDNAFRELGVDPWEFPGESRDRLRATVESFPPLRVPRLTPESLVTRMRPELGAAAEGFSFEKGTSYIDNARFRVHIVDFILRTENREQIDRNLNSMRRMIAELKERGVKCVVVVTPHDKSYRELINPDHDLLLETFLSAAHECGVDSVLDHYAGDSLVSRECFADCDHLNSIGKQKLSEEIAKELGWKL